MPWCGVPSPRPIGMAIALVIVGGSLLETGAIARTPIESSDSPAPIAAVTGSGDVLVAMAVPDVGVPLAPQGVVVPSSGSMLAVVGLAPAGSLVLAGTLGARAGAAPITLAPDPAERLRALDPDGPAELVVLTALAIGVPLNPDAGDGARWVVTTQAAEQATAAKKPADSKGRDKRPRWWRRTGPWRNSPRVTWYGPGFYGNRTACGQRYTRYVVGVAHRTLPCGTMVQFRWHGRTAVAPVIDRGPYGGPDLVFDWSAWLACRTFRPKGQRNGCFTRADVRYRVVGKVDLDRWFRRRKP